MTVRPGLVSYQGHYAGSVSRFAAFAIDLAVSSAVFSLALAAISYGVHVVTGHSVSWNRSSPVVAVLFVLWQFVYFGYSWAVSGRTFGMATLGIRVVGADGSVLEPRQGIVRALVFPLSFLLWASSASWYSGSTVPCTISSPAPPSSTPGMPAPPASASSPAKPSSLRHPRLTLPE